jgi:hypothetical protein
MRNAVFWDVASCRSCVNRRFGEIYRLHLQGRNICERGTSVSRWLQGYSRIVLPLVCDLQDMRYTHTQHNVTYIHTQRGTDHVQDVGDATAGPGDSGHDSGHRTACLHHPQLTVKQQVEREHAAEGGGTHLRLCTQFTWPRGMICNLLQLRFKLLISPDFPKAE